MDGEQAMRYYEDSSVTLYNGDATTVLATSAAGRDRALRRHQSAVLRAARVRHRLVRTGETVEEEQEPADLLADITDAMGGEQRLRIRVVLARIAALDSEYDGWTRTDLKAAVAECGITPGNSHGVRVLRAVDIADAIRARDNAETTGEDSHGDRPGNREVPSGPSNRQTPRAEQRKHRPGRSNRKNTETRLTPGKRGLGTHARDSLSGHGGGGDG